MHSLHGMGSKFCVKFQRAPLKFHTKFRTHTLQSMHFTVFYFCVWVTISLNCDVISLSETGPWLAANDTICVILWDTMNSWTQYTAIRVLEYSLNCYNLSLLMAILHNFVMVILILLIGWMLQVYTDLSGKLRWHRGNRFISISWRVCLTLTSN